MEKEGNQTTKKNLIHNIIDELNKNDVLQQFLQPCIDYIKVIVKPYFTIYMISQLIIIVLLLALLYFVIHDKLKK